MAACDRDVLGKKFSSGRLQIEVNERFYGGSLAGEDDVFFALASATIANLVGNNVVGMAVERSLVSAGNVIEIGGVKHAQIISIPEQR